MTSTPAARLTAAELTQEEHAGKVVTLFTGGVKITGKLTHVMHETAMVINFDVEPETEEARIFTTLTMGGGHALQDANPDKTLVIVHNDTPEFMIMISPCCTAELSADWWYGGLDFVCQECRQGYDTEGRKC